MTREITIGYETATKKSIDLEIRAPYFLFGTQRNSKQFWSLPIWNQIGVSQLSELGKIDPVNFVGWEMLSQLSFEIKLYSEHIEKIEFDTEIKTSWLAHLVYCYNVLRIEAPSDAIPFLSIG